MKLSYLIAFTAVVVASTAAPASASTGLTTINLAEDLQVAPELSALRSLRGANQDVSNGDVKKPKKGNNNKDDKKHEKKNDKKDKKKDGKKHTRSHKKTNGGNQLMIF